MSHAGMRRMGWLLLVSGLVNACGGHTPRPVSGAPHTSRPIVVTGEPETLRFSADLGVDLALMRRTPSGLYYRDSQIGKGALAEPGMRVRVAYQGWLADGRLFDASATGFAFALGRGSVIRGWDEGVVGMKAGGRRLLVIRPGLAYGRESPGGGIPPNATLIFDVRLVALSE